MDQICLSVCDRLPSLSAKYPWLLIQNRAFGNQTEYQNFYTLHDQLCQYRCLIPEFAGKRIWGCFNDWVILSSYVQNMWSFWNPVTSKIIRLPVLILKNGETESIVECCLSSPPDDPSSVLILITGKHTIVFCRINCKRKRFKWTEMSYAKQLRNITGYDNGFLHKLTCCNGKIYALNTVGYSNVFVHFDVVFKDKEVTINILPMGELAYPYINLFSSMVSFLKGCCSELFFIKLGFDEQAENTLCAVYLFKLDMTSLMWEEMEDLKNATFLVDLSLDYSIFYVPAIASELGGYVHIFCKSGKVIHSYDVKNKTISLTSMPFSLSPTHHVLLWEYRLLTDSREEEDKENETVVTLVKDDEVDVNSPMIEPHDENVESRLLNLHFDVLKMVMEFCVGVEYLKFRATCKHCRLAAPMIRWGNETTSKRLQNYSLVSPWLMVFDRHQRVITFTDPMFGDKYFIKTPRELIGDLRIHCSMYGWLLLRRLNGPLMFFNPFTSNIRELPLVPYLESYCFSAPPTSPDCMVVGFTTALEWHVYIHFVAREQSWRRFSLNFGSDDPRSFRFPTFCNQHLYALCNDGGLDRFMNIDQANYTWSQVIAEVPEVPKSSCKSSTQYFLTKRDQHVLLIAMSELGECVEVFKLNDSTKEWVEINSLGSYMIYISRTTCLCIEAKTREMENKIYFPRLHNKSKKIIFYSLKTSRYHTLNGKNVEKSLWDFMETKHHLNPHTWIESSWS